MPGTETKHKVRDVNVRMLRGGSGPPLLFLHGANGLPVWLPVFDLLAKQFEVFVPEHPGFGTSDNPAWLVGVQLLDGIGAGIYGAIFPVIVADLMRNTGRFNVAQGAIATAQGTGAALSTALAGIVVVKAGYSAAFLTLGGIAAMGFLVFGLAFPSRVPAAHRSQQLPRGSVAAE